VLVEHAAGEPDELSLQALALARGYAAAIDGAIAAVLIGAAGRDATATLGAHGVTSAFVAQHDALDDPDGFAPDAWAASLAELIERLAPAAVLAAGSDRGNEILARLGARLEQPMAANCTEAAPANGAGARVTRIRWGGSLLEEATLDGTPVLLTIAPHALAAQAVEGPPQTAPEAFTPALAAEDQRVVVVERVAREDRRRVADGRRRRGLRRAGRRLDRGLRRDRGGSRRCWAAPSAARAPVTMAGWRPHSDQVGQTGTKDRARALHPLRHQRGDAAHGGLQGRQAAAGDQPRRRGADPGERRLRGDRRSAHRRAAINAAIKKARET